MCIPTHCQDPTWALPTDGGRGWGWRWTDPDFQSRVETESSVPVAEHRGCPQSGAVPSRCSTSTSLRTEGMVQRSHLHRPTAAGGRPTPGDPQDGQGMSPQRGPLSPQLHRALLTTLRSVFQGWPSARMPSTATTSCRRQPSPEPRRYVWPPVSHRVLCVSSFCVPPCTCPPRPSLLCPTRFTSFTFSPSMSHLVHVLHVHPFCIPPRSRPPHPSLLCPTTFTSSVSIPSASYTQVLQIHPFCIPPCSYPLHPTMFTSYTSIFSSSSHYNEQTLPPLSHRLPSKCPT